MMQTTKLVIFASSSFALPSIELLLQAGYLGGVILPDPAEVDEQALQVQQLAALLQHNKVPYHFCCAAKLPELSREFDRWQARAAVLATFPYLIPSDLLAYFDLGVYNIHGSALPYYKGAAPVYWQIRNQEREAAVTLHCVTSELDSGNIVVQQPISIAPCITGLGLSNQMSQVSSQIVLALAQRLETTGKAELGVPQANSSSLTNVPQSVNGNQSKATVEAQSRIWAPKPTKRNSDIDLNLIRSDELAALCRASAGTAFPVELFAEKVCFQLIEANESDTLVHGCKAGTILAIGLQDGLVMALNGEAVRLSVVACDDGVYSGVNFARRFQISIGMLIRVPSHYKGK
ncbi:hypothetical protein L4C42_18195 [Vibrio wakamikoensis]|uniref:formyltransferase family protein n=1 Tax=Vibrio wakamikoensis TaxID=2910251 RepID=UPI003D244385